MFTLLLSSMLIVMWMRTPLVCLAEYLRTYLQVPALVQDTSCSSALALSSGKVIFKQRLPSAPSMQNMLPSPPPSETLSPSNEFFKNLSTAYTFPTQLLSFMLKFLKSNSVYLLAMNHNLSEQLMTKQSN